jgi:hypothetical protein
MVVWLYRYAHTQKHELDR